MYREADSLRRHDPLWMRSVRGAISSLGTFVILSGVLFALTNLERPEPIPVPVVFNYRAVYYFDGGALVMVLVLAFVILPVWLLLTTKRNRG
jgi:hypothetical protein